MQTLLTRSTFTVLVVLFQWISVAAQLTLNVTAIPANTPPGSKIYVAGTFNTWNPGDPSYTLTPLGGGQFQIVLNPPVGEVRFKFTLGNWDKVEVQANGGFLPDRTFNYTGQPSTLNLAILNWKGIAGSSGTASPNVQVLDNQFFMPQLNRSRRVWLYLPPDYATTTKKYPVLYLQDGQSLFDDETSFAGEWKVDEALNQLHAQGDYGCIVVGVDNGGQDRLDEYSPWVNAQYNEGGQGDEYVDFLVNTLKPYIDANYRTLPGRNTTGIGGSSMGGLISMYAFSERQDVFSKALIFSPAFWFGGNNPATHVASHAKQGAARVYFMCGDDEEEDGNSSNYVVEDMLEVADAMGTAGFALPEKQFLTPADGKHSEWFWAREFPDAYVWLFAESVAPVKDPSVATTLDIYPNPADSWINISGASPSEKISVKIYSAAGKLLRNISVYGNDPIWTGDLPTGVYAVKLRKKAGKWQTRKLLK